MRLLSCHAICHRCKIATIKLMYDFCVVSQIIEDQIKGWEGQSSRHEQRVTQHALRSLQTLLARCCSLCPAWCSIFASLCLPLCLHFLGVARLLTAGPLNSTSFKVIQLIIRIMCAYHTSIVLFCKVVCSHTRNLTWIWYVFPHTISLLTLLLWSSSLCLCFVGTGMHWLHSVYPSI